ncbi:MAG: glycosyl hydrolase, partial [Elusimicrobia bacterium]|nr:glycosyl hydrolase [Elusimicrobiota bacterium]
MIELFLGVRPANDVYSSMAVFMKKILAVLFIFISLLFCASLSFCATISVGNGSYTDTLPGGEPAPPTEIHKTSNITGSIPTNDWWTSAISSTFSYRLYAYPNVYKCEPNGLLIGYPDILETADVSYYGTEADAPFRQQLLLTTKNGFSSNDVKVDAYSDWTVTTRWEDPGDINNNFKATIGQGLPFAYFDFSLNISTAQISFPIDWAQGQFDIYGISGSTTPFGWDTLISTDCITVRFLHYVSGKTKYFGIYAPSGTSFKLTNSGHTLEIYFPATDRFLSVAPLTALSDLAFFYNYAYAFVTGSQIDWSFNETNQKLTTNYNITTSSKRLGQTNSVLALFPHQWKNSTNSYLSQTFPTLRGLMKLKIGSSFSTTQDFNGILPMLPDKGDYNKTTLQTLLNNDKNLSLGSTGTYYHGKELWRMASLLPIADQLGDTASKTTIINKLKNDLTSWFTYSTGETYGYFYHDSLWGTMIGYDAEPEFHTEKLNDHHFHYGYFIYASALLAMYDSDFKNNYGGMVEHLIRDIASPNRSDSMYPFLRNFSPYEGHSWADGMAQNVDGNNLESSSEAMNAWAGIYLWGQATDNATYKNLGIYLYTTEYAAIKEYFFDIDQQTYGAGYTHDTVGRVFGGKADYNTWFGSDPEYIHGIQFMPETPSSLYLGYNPAYCQTNYNHMVTQNGGTETIWQDVLWQYQSFYDPASAISKYDVTPSPDLTSSPKTYLYYFIHNLNILGRVDTSAYTRAGTSAVFNNVGTKTYVCFNSSNTYQNIIFYNRSDDSYIGQMEVAPYQVRASSDIVPPSEVSNASLTSNLSLTLSWTNPSSDYASTVILRSTVSYPSTHRDGTEVYNNSGTAFIDSDVSLGITYYYKIFVRDPSNNFSLTGVTLSGIPVDLTAPATVTDLLADTGNNPGEINLSWSMPGENGWSGTLPSGSQFKIQRSILQGVTWSTSSAQITISTSGISPYTNVSYTLTGLFYGTTYYLKIWHADELQNWSLVSNTATTWAQTANISLNDISASLSGVREGVMSWADFDKDGDLDLAVCGNYTTKIYRNDLGTFTDINAGLPGVFMGSLDWGDFDNDGDPDLAVCGYTGSTVISKIYRNDSGTFVDIGAPLVGVYSGSIKWADIDNDNDLDLALCGWDSAGNTTYSKIYRNDGGTFVEIPAGLPGVCWASLAWGDYNKDGYADLAITGTIPNPYQYISKIFRNNGNGTFTDINAALTGVEFGATAWGDYDNDTYPDIAISGMINGTTKNSVTKIYHNNGDNTFTDINAGLIGGLYSSLDWGDFDKDGQIDLAFCGWNYSTTRLTKIYKNDLGNFYEVPYALPGVDEGSIECGDYDNDGDLDIALCGNTGSSIIAKIFRNDQTSGGKKMASSPETPESPVKNLPSPETQSPDTIAPGTVDTLSAFSGINSGEILLQWNSPGDDGFTNVLQTGSQARIEYSTFTQVDWSTSSAQIEFSTSGVIPLSLVSYSITGLNSGTTYFLSLWYCDESSNWSNISNMVSGKPQRDLIAPASVGNLSANSGINKGEIN